MASIKLIVREDKAKCFTRKPIYMRLTRNRKVSYVSIGKSVDPRFWDGNAQRVSGKHPNSVRLNSYLGQLVSSVEKEVLKSEERGVWESPKAILRKLKQPEGLTFLNFGNEFLQKLERDQNHSRYKKLKGILSKLSDYTNGHLSFREITTEFLEDYTQWLRDEKGNAINTIHTDLKFIRQLYREALLKDLFEVERNPFDSFRLKTEKTTREFLTEEELQRIRELELSGVKEVCRDMFVLACETGLRISDLLTLRKIHFTGTHLNFQMRKTKEPLRIILSTTALGIVENYVDECEHSSDYLCPPLRGKSFNEIGLAKAIMSKTALFNKYLKKIAEKAEIEKRVTFHVSRHTFGTRALKKKIPVEVVQKLMGHSSIRTTMVYAKVIDEDADAEMAKFG